MNTRELGSIGEEYAANFLISQDYKVVKTNYHKRVGEIDIIAFDYSTREIVFVEVKTRTSSEFGTPQDAITYIKKQIIIKTGLHFLSSPGLPLFSSWRVDLIAVKLDKDKNLKDITHLKNILDG